MSRVKVPFLLVLLPLAAFGSGIATLLDRVPTLPATIEDARSGLSGREAQAAALEREIEAVEAALSVREEEALAANQETAVRQQENLENLTGMSAEEMEAADESEIESKMLGAMGMSMADMEALEGMDDAEIEAYFAAKQANTQGLQKFADAAPQSSDPARLDRLTREFGDWQSGYSGRAAQGSQQLKALEDRWAQDHARLNARLDSDLAPRVASVPEVDCGEAGSYPDAIAMHAIAIERARAHAKLAPDHLVQGHDFLSARREAVEVDAAFADRFVSDAEGIEEMAVQAISVQQAALQGISELLVHTLEINRNVVLWADEAARLEAVRPKSSCG